MLGSHLDPLLGRQQVRDVELHHRVRAALAEPHERSKSTGQLAKLLVGRLSPPGRALHGFDEVSLPRHEVDGERQLAHLEHHALPDCLERILVALQLRGAELDHLGLEAQRLEVGFRTRPQDRRDGGAQEGEALGAKVTPELVIASRRQIGCGLLHDDVVARQREQVRAQISLHQLGDVGSRGCHRGFELVEAGSE